MNKKKQYQAVRSAVLILLLLCVALCCAACRQKLDISIQGALSDNAVIEYTGQRIQFPLGCVVDGSGRIVSYGVTYKVVNLADQSEIQDDYASFDLKTGNYQLIYSFIDDAKVQKTVNFSVQDTTSPTIEFLDIPNGLFLQDITEDTVNKLPLYSLDDASKDDGIELQAVLSFKGESDTDFREYPYRKLNNSYEVDSFGSFRYELTATDAYGNQSVAVAQWMVKDRDWKPDTLPGEGILADYSSEGYRNLIEGGDANQYYKIGNDYADAWLEEFEGAQGVLKIDLPFNNAVGWGNNTIRLRLPKSFTKEDLAGKYLAVRIYVEGEHIKSDFLFAGNNVEFRQEDATTRAFTTGVTGLKAGQWKTFYIEADTAEHIGMYPNATYNPNTTFYEGGDPADSIQLCFHREAGYFNDMTLYIDSISIAEFLPDTQITVSGSEATWTPVTGAEGYLVDLNGETSVQEETRADLPGEKGYIRVTPLGNGVTTLDAQTVTAVYGLDPGNSLAKFDDKLYIDLFTDQLKFSTDAEHNGYRPRSLNFTQTGNGLTVDIATGSWGVVTGIRFQFPKAQSKGSNTTLVLNMQVSGSEYGQIRVYDYTGKQLGVLKLDSSNTGKFCEFEIDISSYSGKLEGIQLIFGPNRTFTNVSAGVSVTFKDISLKNTYYPITVDGQSLMCAGKRKLTDGYTNRDVVQFTTFFNYSVPRDDTPLNFSGTVMLDGKKLESSAVTVVGYPNTDTICFKVPHSGKVLTILKGSFIYYNGIAVEVEETFNAKWNGSAWVPLANIPDAPAPEYVTLSDGSVKLVENRVVLEPGYTNENVVQFLNVYDFGVAADDTPLGFEGIVMLGGEKLNNPNFVGYPKNMTIALKTPHQGQVLTILEGAVIYSGDKAVVVDKTFNALWNGNTWQSVGEIPSVPETQYVTLNDGVERELVGKVTLTAGFTLDNLVQFTNVYDFGCPEDSTPIGFQGTVLLQGAEVKNPNVVGYLNSTTVGIQNLSHKGKVVTVMEGAYFYNDTQAVLVKNTFNALWDGEKWTQVDEIPEPPAKEYITVDGAKKELLGKITLTPGYTNENVVQFTNAVDFGVPADDTALGFSGTVLLGGKEQKTVNFVGYPNNTTICLKLPHKGQILTVMADTVLWYGDYAVVVAETFNAKWDGEKWMQVDKIPEPPAKEYITIDGVQRELVGKVELTAGFTLDNLVQFTNVYDFGCPEDSTPVGFRGTVLLQGAEVKNPRVVGYLNSTTVGIERISHKNKVVTIMEGSVFYNDTEAVQVVKTFNAKWDGEKWTQVDEIPEPEAPEVIESLQFTYRWGTANVLQVNTNLPVTTPVANFTTSDNGCSIDESGNRYQQVGWIQMHNPDETGGVMVLTFHFNSNFSAGQTYVLPAGAVFGFTDGNTYPLDKDYIFQFDGNGWTTLDEEPETTEPETTEPGATEPEEQTVSFQYRWGNSNT
ncbi:MAG: hypothetical protein J6B67_03530, partial [Oscillospiraceae bacterium]|nr:hypothetical protein [Oscillospiraceae bacterium]